MLADARAHQKHAVASSWGHGTHQGHHLPLATCLWAPWGAPRSIRCHPAGDPGCPRWLQGMSLVIDAA